MVPDFFYIHWEYHWYFNNGYITTFRQISLFNLPTVSSPSANIYNRQLLKFYFSVKHKKIEKDVTVYVLSPSLLVYILFLGLSLFR